jgi:hypothetical protein
MMPPGGYPSRQEKEEYIRDLYFNQKKKYHEIAKLARVSPRDIKGILYGGTQKEQAKSKAAQAYDLFSKGKSPMEVAIALDLREPEVTQLYKESWNLKQIRELNRIYLETEGNLAPFLSLYKLAMAEGMKVEHVIWLLTTANKGLPELENKYYKYKSEVDSLESKRQNLVRITQDYDAQVKALGREFDNYCLRCEQEEKKLADLIRKRMREENLVRQFRNNADYHKIREIIDERVHQALSNGRRILELAALSLIESIRHNPEKYSSLIQYNTSVTTDYNISKFDPFFMYRQQPPLQQQQQVQSKIYFSEDYIAMLSEDANKLLERLAKVVGEEIINDYAVSKSPSPSLPAFLPASGDFSSNKEARKGLDIE